MRELDEIEDRLSYLLANRIHMGKCKKKTQNELNGQIIALRWVLNERKTRRKPKPKGTPSIGCCPEAREVYRRPSRPKY